MTRSLVYDPGYRDMPLGQYISAHWSGVQVMWPVQPAILEFTVGPNSDLGKNAPGHVESLPIHLRRLRRMSSRVVVVTLCPQDGLFRIAQCRETGQQPYLLRSTRLQAGFDNPRHEASSAAGSRAVRTELEPLSYQAEVVPVSETAHRWLLPGNPGVGSA